MVSSWQRNEAENTLHKQLDADYTDDIAFLENTPALVESLLHSLE